MLRKSDITFYRIMTAGYLSAEACDVLLPKTRLKDLSMEECCLYQENIAKELLKLFNDAEILSAIQCMEAIDIARHNNDNRPFEILDSLLLKTNDKVIHFIAQIGGTYFVQEYAFASLKYLPNKKYISQDNIDSIKSFISRYRKEFCDKYGIHSAFSHEVETTVDEASIVCGTDTTHHIYVPIDDDALGVGNSDLKNSSCT